MNNAFTTDDIKTVKFRNGIFESLVIKIVGDPSSKTKNKIIGEIINKENFDEVLMLSSLYCDSDKVTEMIERLTNEMCENYQRSLRGEKLIDNRILLIIDESFTDARVALKDPKIRRILIFAKNLDLTIILSISYELSIKLPSIVRTSIDYVFLLGEDLNTDVSSKLTDYYSCHPSFHSSFVFSEAFDKVKYENGALVINNKYHEDAEVNKNGERLWGYWEETDDF